MKDENYINIQGWMINRLNLKGNELVLYAIIYGFSQDGETKYRGSLSYIQNALKISKPTAISLLKKLEGKSLIIKEENKTGNLFSINQQVVKKLYQSSKETLLVSGKETLPVGSKETLPVGSKETLPNNNIYINNNNNKYNNSNETKNKNHFKKENNLSSYDENTSSKVAETNEQLNQDVSSGSGQFNISSPPTPSPLTGLEIKKRWEETLGKNIKRIDARKLDLIYNYCKENKLKVNKEIMKTFLNIIITITYDDIKFYLNKKYDNTNHLLNTLNKFNKAS